jgi:lipopolysaccharide export system protein LptC
MLVVAFFNPFATKLGSLSFGALSVEGTKIVMDRPKLAGFRSDGQAYLLTAERALQDIKQPTTVQLRKVDGEMGMAGGEPTHLSADAGVYDNLAEHMELSGNVRIKNTRFTVLLRSARFDFKSGVYGSDDRVEVQGDDGTTIFADRASAINHGQELTFEGHVRTNVVPQTDREPASDVKGINP